MFELLGGAGELPAQQLQRKRRRPKFSDKRRGQLVDAAHVDRVLARREVPIQDPAAPGALASTDGPHGPRALGTEGQRKRVRVAEPHVAGLAVRPTVEGERVVVGHDRFL